jgi:hypothetical protein
MIRPLLLFAIALFTFFDLIGQNNIRSIVLINGEPFIADLSVNGSIVAKYQNVPDYFTNGLDDQQIIALAEKKGLISGGSLELYTDNLDDDKIPDISTFKNISTEPSNNKQYIAFSRGRAILNRVSVDQIRAISDAYTENKISSITINAYHKDTEESRILAANRGNAISRLLSTFGVNSNDIQVNMPYGADGDQLYFVYLSFTN